MAEVRDKGLSDSWSWVLEVNQEQGWCERLGMWLRFMANRIDGRSTLALRARTAPKLQAGQWREIQLQGIDQMKRSLGDSVKMEAQERLLQRLQPALFCAEDERKHHG